MGGKEGARVALALRDARWAGSSGLRALVYTKTSRTHLAYVGSGPRDMAATPVRETSTRPIGRMSSMN